MRYNNINYILPKQIIPIPEMGPASDEIWYTSTDGNIVAPNSTDTLPTIVSNTYSDGKGIIKFTDNINVIPEWMYYNENNLLTIDFPKVVTEIPFQCFNSCNNLQDCNIKNTVTAIGFGAFANCTSLTVVNIPDSVVEIVGHSFVNDSEIVEVNIGSGLQIIGENIFGNCTSLSTINYNGTIAQWNTITKDSDWHSGVPATVVHCTDGDAQL